MKNSVLIIILVVIVVIGGGAFFLSQQINKDAMKQDTFKGAMVDQNATPTYTEDSTMEKDLSAGSGQGMMASGQYVVHSKNVLENIKGKRVVLFFFANWCPTCKPADEDFTKNMSKIPRDIMVVRVNYNDSDTDQDEKDLAKKYGITYQHTYVQIDETGNEVRKWNGGNLEELVTNTK